MTGGISAAGDIELARMERDLVTAMPVEEEEEEDAYIPAAVEYDRKFSIICLDLLVIHFTFR
jgi:hypothetical protein